MIAWSAGTHFSAPWGTQASSLLCACALPRCLGLLQVLLSPTQIGTGLGLLAMLKARSRPHEVHRRGLRNMAVHYELFPSTPPPTACASGVDPNTRSCRVVTAEGAPYLSHMRDSVWCCVMCAPHGSQQGAPCSSHMRGSVCPCVFVRPAGQRAVLL